MQDDWFISSGH